MNEVTVKDRRSENLAEWIGSTLTVKVSSDKVTLTIFSRSWDAYEVPEYADIDISLSAWEQIKGLDKS